MFQFSKPTNAQVIKTVELTVVTYGFSFFGFLVAQPAPFTKATLAAASAAGVAAVYRVAKSLLTNL